MPRKKRERRAPLPRDAFVSVRTHRRATYFGGNAQAFAAAAVLDAMVPVVPAAVHASYITRFDGGNTWCHYIDAMVNALLSAVIMKWVAQNFVLGLRCP